MQLIFHQAGDVNTIRSWSTEGIVVGDTTYSQAVVITADRLHCPWSVTLLGDLNAESAQTLLAMAPEIVLLGTGQYTRFPPAAFAAALMQRGVGCEAMNTGAACRTYNVLIDEGRQALALIFPGA